MGVNSLPWYHIPVLKEVGDNISLTGEEWHHCFHVLRMATGESIILFDGKGHCHEGIIQSASKNEGIIELTHDRTSAFQVDRTYRLSIGFAPTKSIDRTEFAVEKLVELGVDAIYFLKCDHSERSRIRLDRMEKIVLSAAKQSRKITLPVMSDLRSPASLVSHVKKEEPETRVYFCHLDAVSKPVVENYSSGQNVLMLIGPEGGFTPEETDQMMKRGAEMVTLGPYRLRVETAVITACATIHILNGLKSKT